MKLFHTILAVLAASVTLSSAGLDGWMDDLDKALEKAKADNKPLLVEFTGSDWCPPCITIRKNVFSKKEFVDAASKKWILVEIDLPNKNKEVAKKNRPLAKKFKIRSVPTVILLDENGKEFHRFSASRFRTTEAFLKNLDVQLEKKDMD